jgi:hypothetical protein
MRKLQKNELNLLVLFASAVFLAVNLMAVRAWLQHRGKLAAEISQAKTALATAKSWITAAEDLQSAKDWMQNHPALGTTSDGASTDLLNKVRSLAEKNNLKVIEETLLPTEVGQSGFVVLQTKIGGPFPGVAGFLFDLQSPSSWRSVSKMTIRSDNEPPNVVVDMEIHQYYHTPESSDAATEP